MFTGSPSALLWGAVFTALLAVGCVTDVRERRIPNGLVLAILALGLVYAATTGPLLPALGRSLLGVALGFGIWIAFHVAGVLGAGDVKFFAAVGAWLGPGATWRAALVAALAGGVLAVLFLLRERRLGSALQRAALAASARSLAVARDEGSVTARAGAPLPYGVALAVGALVTAWLPDLL